MNEVRLRNGALLFSGASSPHSLLLPSEERHPTLSLLIQLLQGSPQDCPVACPSCVLLQSMRAYGARSRRPTTAPTAYVLQAILTLPNPAILVPLYEFIPLPQHKECNTFFMTGFKGGEQASLTSK